MNLSSSNLVNLIQIFLPTMNECVCSFHLVLETLEVDDNNSINLRVSISKIQLACMNDAVVVKKHSFCC